MSLHGTDILGPDEGMPGAMIAAQNDAALELGEENLEPDSNVQPVDSKVTAIEKVVHTIESNECIQLLDESTNQMSPVAVIAAQNASKPDLSDKTLEPDQKFTESTPKSISSPVSETTKLYEPQTPEKYPFQVLLKKRNAPYVQTALDTLHQVHTYIIK